MLHRHHAFEQLREVGEVSGVLLGAFVKGFCWGAGFATGFFMIAKLFHFT